MYVCLQAYKQAAPDTKDPAQPLFAFVTLYNGAYKVFEPLPTAIAPNSASRLGTMPLTFNFGINALPPGEYDCQVTVLNPAKKKSTFWRAPFLIVP